MSEKRIAAIWARVSTKDKQEPSLESQVADVKLWLEGQGWAVPPERVIVIHWTSKNILACPDMQRLLGWVKRSEVGAVGVLHLDRFACRMGQMGQILDAFREGGAELLAKNSPLQGGLLGEAMAMVITIAKAFQVERADEGSKDGLHKRATLRGLPTTCQAPYGYDWDKSRTRLIANANWENRALIVNLFLKRATLKGIAKELHRRGIPSPKGRDWWVEPTISLILKDTVNFGEYRALRRESVEPKQRRGNTYGKTSSKHLAGIPLPNIVIENPIITKAQHDWILGRLEQNRLNSKRNGKRDYLLKGMIHYEGDNLGYYGRDIRGRSWAYRYSPRGQRNGNPRPYLPGRKLETLVETRAREILTSNDVLERELGWRQGVIQETITRLQDELRRLERKWNDNSNAESELVGLRIRGKVSDGAYDKQRTLLSAERQWVAEERERVEEQLARLNQESVSLVSLEQLRGRLQQKLASTEFADRRFILEALGTKIIVTTCGSIEVEFAIPTERGKGAIALSSPQNACSRYSVVPLNPLLAIR